MPQLAALYKKYNDKGFEMVGIHCQAGSDEEILKPIKANKVKYPIARNGNGPGVGGNGIPHMFVFDTTGKLVWEGHGVDEAEKVIKKALREVKAAGESSGTTPSTAGGSNSTPSKPSSSTAPEVLIPERAWTNTEGKTLMAALLSVSGDQGTFKRKDGTKFTYAISKLAQPDQDAINDAVKKAAESK